MTQQNIIITCSIVGGVTGAVTGVLVSVLNLSTGEAVTLAILAGILVGNVAALLLRPSRPKRDKKDISK